MSQRSGPTRWRESLTTRRRKGHAMTDADRPRLVHTLRYERAPEAIDWLCTAFGFERQAVYSGAEPGSIGHAQLTFPGGMVMLSSASDDPSEEYNRTTAQPPELDGRNTSAPYIVVDDADAHYAQATASGAKILRDIQAEDYGGRGYTCADPEGFVWNFGTYDPWSAEE